MELPGGPEEPPEHAVDVQEQDVLDREGAGTLAARGGLIRSGAYLVGLLITGISAALVFRHLGRDRSGVYVTGNTLVGFIATLSDLGLTAVGLKELAQRPANERWGLARNLLGLRLTLTLTAGVVVTVIAWVAYSATMAVGVALLTVGLLVFVTQDNVALSLALSLQNGRLALLDLTRSIVTVLFMASLALAGAGLIPFFAAGLPGALILLLLTLMLTAGEGRVLRPRFNLSVWLGFLRPMVPFSAALAASAFYLRAAQIIVSAICSRTDLGYYSLAYRIVEAAAPVPGLLIGALLPILVRAATSDSDALDARLGRMCEVNAVIGVWVSLSVAVGAPLAVGIIGGPQFKHADSVLALQGVTLGAVFISSVWGYGLFALGEYRTLLIINIIGLSANAGAVIALTEIFGVNGAAAGSSLVGIIYAGVAGWFMLRLRPGLTFRAGLLLRILLAGIGALAPLALGLVGVPVIVRLVLSSSIYVILLILLRAVPPEIAEPVGARVRQLVSRAG